MHQVLRSGLLLIALAGPAAAADPKPNALTAKEAAEGWIMLFDGETTFGWQTVGKVFVSENKNLVVRDGTGIATAPVFGSGELHLTYSRAGQGVVTVSWPGGAETLDDDVRGKSQAATIQVRATKPGPIGISCQNASVAFSQVAFRPTGLTPLFNGKDLTGWTVFEDPKRQQAKFTVTPAGELHVLGGPGDLQTTAKYADFVLQTEVRTNGPKVNSGIFFRCVPGQYQNGYEVQIQNGFRNNDRSQPTDFGTGAIYRRQLARKVVPNDREWFTLTLIAVGPHIATWVDGYPTTSWTDTRQPHENPRQGLRTAAGHISIQGHNPPMAADLLFRNMRIAEMKKD